MKKRLAQIGLVGFWVSLAVLFYVTRDLHAGPPALYLTPPNNVTQTYQDVSGNYVISAPSLIVPTMQLNALTLSQIATSTPTAIGQIVYCSNCATASVCISTGTSLQNSWSTINTRTTTCN